MELKELHHIVNTHLNENSLAQAKYEEDLLNEYVTVDHPSQKEKGSVITISKNLGCWHLEYEKSKDDGVSIEMTIRATENHDDVNEIIAFVNGHTIHESQEESRYAEIKS